MKEHFEKQNNGQVSLLGKNKLKNLINFYTVQWPQARVFLK
jgi:hypothetical protein